MHFLRRCGAFGATVSIWVFFTPAIRRSDEMWGDAPTCNPFEIASLISLSTHNEVLMPNNCIITIFYKYSGNFLNLVPFAGQGLRYQHLPAVSGIRVELVKAFFHINNDFSGVFHPFHTSL